MFTVRTWRLGLVFHALQTSVCADIPSRGPHPGPTRHSSPLSNLTLTDGGRRRLTERGPHCNRGKIVSRHYSRVDQHSTAAFTTPLLPQCKHFAHGGDGRTDERCPDCPSLKKSQEAIRARKRNEKKMESISVRFCQKNFTLPRIRVRCSLSALHSSER